MPNGYIVDSVGPYFADGANNDAAIMEDILTRDPSFKELFQSGDCLVVDRGYRDVIDEMQTAGYQTFMPNLLAPKQKQFSALEANESRRVQKMRIQTLKKWFEWWIKQTFDIWLNRNEIFCWYLI